ncbi:MAG: Lrp/AsnC ligand binding domain-containing protein [Candidatus Bathyarchaeota archaeon]|nr:Lrp/AsnC ligand binding domain-containing protein [Candidatus Bathyarchaeota archaeon]
MPKAFILLNVDSGFEDAVVKQLRELNVVEEAYVSYGSYDLIAKISEKNMSELKDIITHKIRTLNHVRSTLTLMIMEE